MKYIMMVLMAISTHIYAGTTTLSRSNEFEYDIIGSYRGTVGPGIFLGSVALDHNCGNVYASTVDCTGSSITVHAPDGTTKQLSYTCFRTNRGLGMTMHDIPSNGDYRLPPGYSADVNINIKGTMRARSDNGCTLNNPNSLGNPIPAIFLATGINGSPMYSVESTSVNLAPTRSGVSITLTSPDQISGTTTSNGSYRAEALRVSGSINASATVKTSITPANISQWISLTKNGTAQPCTRVQSSDVCYVEFKPGSVGAGLTTTGNINMTVALE
ncbi:hypothetical protein E2H14_24665 [Salmonella enterica subsp. enterica serovar Muenchen]|nr:hypothetical protein [Salmonella enterica]ECD5989911.1 hypothetical protein [Salmonella enterica subsp. enterica serovar Muenchen]